MLTLTLLNDGTGTDSSANYEWRVSVNGQVIAAGEVHGHDRDDGWPALVRRVADQANRRALDVLAALSMTRRRREADEEDGA